MKRFLFTLLLVVGLLISSINLAQAYTREELNKYKDNSLMAPEFTLKDLDGKDYSLKDYREKMYVVLQTGSST